MPTTITVENAVAEVLGHTLRRVTLDATVDRGLTTLALPAETVVRLGLERRGTARVRRYGLKERDLAGPVTVTIAGRSTTTDCVVAHEAVVGLVVLTALDLVEDGAGALRPRHPEWRSYARAAGRAGESGRPRPASRRASAGTRRRTALRSAGTSIP